MKNRAVGAVMLGLNMAGVPWTDAQSSVFIRQARQFAARADRSIE
jgi:hypothetical protein